MTITKNTLVEMLHNEVGLNKREAKEFIEIFFESLKKNLENGNDIKISGFGNFTLIWGSCAKKGVDLFGHQRCETLEVHIFNVI